MVYIIKPHGGGDEPLPRIRPIDVIPVESEGKPLFVIRDPEMLASPVTASPLVVFVASMLDGKNKRSDVSTAFAKAFNGILLDRRDLDTIVEKLDEALLLDSERFRGHIARLIEEFKRATRREATHAGTAYAAEPEELRKELAGLFEGENAPGKPERRAGAPRPVAAIAPHIDLARGGHEYARVYHALAAAEPPETVVVLGTAHRGGDAEIALTRKTYATPLGEVAPDLEFIDRLAGELPWSPFEHEFLHMQEHTVEIQAVMMRYVWPEADVKLVPVLCGSFAGAALKGTPPADDARLAGFIKALARAAASSSRRVLMLASADLAHVGAQFGDEVPITERLLGKLEDEDMKMLHLVKDLDADGLFGFIAAEEDRRKVCGLPPIYIMLSALRAMGGAAPSGRLTGYGQAYTPEVGSVVTFAGMTFTRGEGAS